MVVYFLNSNKTYKHLIILKDDLKSRYSCPHNQNMFPNILIYMNESILKR